MVAEPIADNALDTQASATADVALSDDRNEVALLEEGNPPAAEAQDAVQDPVVVENLAELKGQALYDKGVELQAKLDRGENLTSEEKATLRRHDQSETDKARVQSDARAKRIENQRQIAYARQNFPDLMVNALTAEINAARDEGREVSPTLLKAAAKEFGDGVFQVLEPLVVQGYEAFMRNDAYRLMGGDSSAAEKLADADGFVGAINVWRDALIEYGKSQSEDGRKLAALQAEHDKLRAEHAKLVGSGLNGSGTTTQGKATPSYASESSLADAYNRGQITRENYAHEYQRLTGKTL